MANREDLESTFEVTQNDNASAYTTNWSEGNSKYFAARSLQQQTDTPALPGLELTLNAVEGAGAAAAAAALVDLDRNTIREQRGNNPRDERPTNSRLEASSEENKIQNPRDLSVIQQILQQISGGATGNATSPLTNPDNISGNGFQGSSERTPIRLPATMNPPSEHSGYDK